MDGILGKKLGMTQIYKDDGTAVPVTVVQAGPCLVVQRKTTAVDGYEAIQICLVEDKPLKANRPQSGHFQKAGVAPMRHLHESRVEADVAAGYEVGQSIATDIFSEGQRVDIVGVSKGRGTSGVVKRHNFAIKRRTHGTHEAFRHAGSIGAGAWPGRVIKGMRMAGRYGNQQMAAINQEIVRIDADRSLLFIRGAVPGHNNAVVRVRPSVRARS